MSSAPQRILIVKLGAIGDVVMAVPAAHALYRAGYAIDWVCGAQVEPILRLYPWINTFVVDERTVLRGGALARMRAIAGLWRRLAGRRYALAATLYYDARYRVLTLPVIAQHKLSLSWHKRDQQLIPGRHHTDEFLRILERRPDGVWPAALAPVPVAALPQSPLQRVAGKPRVVIAPGGAKNLLRDDALRRWPVERYAQLAQLLTAKGIEVVLTGGPDDVWASAAFTGVTDLIGKTGLVETLALLDEADVMVTHDSGPLHLTGMTRVGIVTVFGPVNPNERLPQRSNAVAIWGGEGFACRPCYDGRNYAPCRENGCMLQVSAEQVLREVEAVLEQRKGAGAPPRIVTPPSTVETIR